MPCMALKVRSKISKCIDGLQTTYKTKEHFIFQLLAPTALGE